MKENTTRTDEQIRQLAERRKLLFKDVSRNTSGVRSLTEESQIPPLDPEMVMLFVEGKLDDPNFDLKTRQYKEGYVPPKVPVIMSLPTPQLPAGFANNDNEKQLTETKNQLRHADENAKLNEKLIGDWTKLVRDMGKILAQLPQSSTSAKSSIDKELKVLDKTAIEIAARGEYKSGPSRERMQSMMSFVKKFTDYCRHVVEVKGHSADDAGGRNSPMSSVSQSATTTDIAEILKQVHGTLTDRKKAALNELVHELNKLINNKIDGANIYQMLSENDDVFVQKTRALFAAVGAASKQNVQISRDGDLHRMAAALKVYHERDKDVSNMARIERENDDLRRQALWLESEVTRLKMKCGEA